jgi:hypothetical protein
MPDKTPFEVNPYAPTEEHIEDADDLLRPIEQQTKDGVIKQFIDNARINITPSKIEVTDHCVW